MGLFSRASAPKKALNAANGGEKSSAAHSDGALDAVASVLRALGKHAFDLDTVDAETTNKRCENWARQMLVGKKDDDQASQPSRDWGGLRRFVNSHRRHEREFVECNVSGLKEVVLQLVQGLRGLSTAERSMASTVEASLTTIEGVAETGTLEQLKRDLPEILGGIRQAMTEQRQRTDRQVSLLADKLRAMRVDLQQAKKQLAIDPLTQIYNRGAFDETLERQLALASFSGQNLALILFDIDHFKWVNDTYGHPVGDQVLKVFAECLVRSFPRRLDLVARYGGEEFAVILFDAEQAAVKRLIERALDRVRSLAIAAGQASISITCSAGYSTLRTDDTAAELVGRADHSLYQAKGDGRDRVRGSID